MLGCLAALIVGQQGFQKVVTVCGAAFGGYILGTTVALALLAKEKPMELLASS